MQKQQNYVYQLNTSSACTTELVITTSRQYNNGNHYHSCQLNSFKLSQKRSPPCIIFKKPPCARKKCVFDHKWCLISQWH